MIVLSEEITGTNADILSGSLLETVAPGAWLIFEMQAADCIAANNYVATIQLPNSDTPLRNVLVPAHDFTAGTTGIIKDSTKLAVRLNAGSGGKIIWGITETGDTECMWRVTLE